MRRKRYPGIRLMVVEISSCFLWSTGWSTRTTHAQPVRRRAPMVITDRQGTDVDLELWHDDVVCGGLLISARSRGPQPAHVEPRSRPLRRSTAPRPIAIDIGRCTQLRIGLLCALGDNSDRDSAPDVESPWSAPIEPHPVLRFMVGPVASQHALTIGRRSEPHVEVDVLSCCVGDSGNRRRDVCAQLSLRAACTNVYDFGSRSAVFASFADDKLRVAQLHPH